MGTRMVESCPQFSGTATTGKHLSRSVHLHQSFHSDDQAIRKSRHPSVTVGLNVRFGHTFSTVIMRVVTAVLAPS